MLPSIQQADHVRKWATQNQYNLAFHFVKVIDVLGVEAIVDDDCRDDVGRDFSLSDIQL
jgi:hypothetical protein